MSLLNTHSHVAMAKFFADFLPSGDAWAAKNISDTNFYKLILGLSKNLVRIEQLINLVFNEIEPTTTEALISLFEEMVGIPDDCFSNKETLERRRKQVIFKLTVKCDTAQSFIDIANYWGYACAIGDPSLITYPLEYPMIYTSYMELANTLIIYLPISLGSVDTYPLEYPWIYSTQGGTNFLECIFNRLKPATLKLIFSYTLPG